MNRSPRFADVIRSLRIALACEADRLSTSDALVRARQSEVARAEALRSRRDWLTTVGRAGAAGAVASVVAPIDRVFGAQSRPSIDVAIVGAGLAGLACADALAARGVAATLYDANTRTGGRCC